MCLVQMSAHPAQLFKFPSHPKIFLPRSAAGQPHSQKKENQFERAAKREGREGGGFCWFKLTTVTAPRGEGAGRGGREGYDAVWRAGVGVCHRRSTV